MSDSETENDQPDEITKLKEAALRFHHPGWDFRRGLSNLSEAELDVLQAAWNWAEAVRK